jgi:hypothetical protein
MEPLFACRLPMATSRWCFGALETDYAFSRSVSLSTVLQVDTVNAQAASAHIGLGWNCRSDSDLQVICTASQQFATWRLSQRGNFSRIDSRSSSLIPFDPEGAAGDRRERTIIKVHFISH